jgi:tetratricopeptide (TPR) repeat protein
LRGDELVKLNNYQSALSLYNKSIEIDQNEYSMSNKVLCLNKIKDFKNAVTTAGEGIKKITKFNVGTDFATKEKDSSILLLKLHYRKAKAHEELG